MRFTISAKDLSDAIRAGVHGKSHSEISTRVHLRASTNGTVSCTTRRHSWQKVQRVQAEEVRQSGEISVDAALLVSLLGNRKGPANIFVEGDQLNLETKSSEYTLPSFPADSFPIDQYANTEEVDISPTEMAHALVCVGDAAPKDDVRQAFNNVRFEPEYAVATDGKRLSSCKISYEGTPFLLAKGDIDLVARFITDESHILRGSSTNYPNRLIIRNPDSELSISYLGSAYPDWRKALTSLDRERLFDCVCDADELSAAIKRCSQLVAGQFANVILSVHSNELEIKPCKGGTVLDDSYERIEAETHNAKGEGGVIFSAALLSGVIAHFSKERIVWEGNHELQPQRFYHPGRNDEHILTPVRI